MAVWCAVNSFNAGELSPKMIGRNDISQYSKGCQKLCNFMVTPYGAVERRPGTEYLGNLKYSAKDVRLIRFVVSSSVAYVLEFGDKYLRILRGREYIKSNNAILEISTPYSAGELAALRYIQSADVMTIVHPDHPVMELKRTAADVFALSEKAFAYPPMLEPNLDDDATITPSETAVGKTVTLTASKSIFAAGNVGGYFQLIHVRKKNEISIDFSADGVSGTLEVLGYWTFTTHGTWSGTLTIQRSFDSGATWGDYRTYSSAKDSNTSSSGEEENEGVLYRLKMSGYEGSTTGTLKLCRCLLVNPDFTVTGVVKITAVASGTSASGTIIRRIGEKTATTEWNEGAWSNRRGFPCSLAFYEERMLFGGTASRPQTVWGSKTNAWDRFLLGDKDDDGLEFTLAGDTVSTIVWMSQHDALIVGTMDSEWTVSASSSEAALTPSNFRIRRQSVYGSESITAQMVGEVLLFVQRGGRKVREFVYSWESDAYAAPDMTILADHITGSGIKEIALQQLPDSILWCLLGNGTIAALTYERDQEVIGWQRIVTDGRILSMAIVPEGNEDRIYIAVERNGKRMIERFMLRSDNVYMDSFVKVTGSNISTVGNLSHLEGLTLQIVADGAVQREKVVASGKVVLDEAADTVYAGLAYTSELAVMPIEVDTQEGSSIFRRKSIGEVRLRYYNSLGGEVRANNGKWQQIISRDVNIDIMDTALAPKTEMVKINTLSGFADSIDIQIRQTDPVPFNVTALTVNYEIME